MHSQLPIYQYQALQYPDSIRLLSLLPGPSDEIACNLFDVRTSELPQYEALSYAWGEPRYTHTVRVNAPDAVIKITENLHDALLALRARSSNTERTIWIDAICINQPDLKEKGQQVAHMDSIFRNAQRVIVWLGREDVADELEAVQRVARISRRYFEVWTDGFDAKLPFLQELREPLSNGAMHRLLSRPWFERVWIVQEVVLGRDLQFYAGAHVLELEPLEDAVAMVADLYERSTFAAVFPDQDMSTRRVFSGIIYRTRRLFRYRYRRLNALEQGYDMRGEDQSVLDILGLSTHRKCTDDRDRVYAMLGLLPIRLPIIPDYSKPADGVLREFALHSLVSKDLSILHACGLDPVNRIDVPSFVPSITFVADLDFSSALDAGFDPRAGLGTSPTVHVLSSESLRISGVTDNVIEYMCRPVLAAQGGDHPWMAVLQSYQDCTSWLKRFGHGSNQDSEAYKHIDTVERFLASEVCPSPPPPYNIDVSARYGSRSFFDIFFRTASLQDIDVQSSLLHTSEHHQHTLLRQITIKLAQRSLFMTSAGHLGLGPRCLQRGDRVVIFDGGMTPFVLRPHTCNEKAEVQWKIVGECYLHGWMDGEYFSHTIKDDGRGVTQPHTESCDDGNSGRETTNDHWAGGRDAVLKRTSYILV